jgi:hypothetical protein
MWPRRVIAGLAIEFRGWRWEWVGVAAFFGILAVTAADRYFWPLWTIVACQTLVVRLRRWVADRDSDAYREKPPKRMKGQ